MLDRHVHQLNVHACMQSKMVLCMHAHKRYFACMHITLCMHEDVYIIRHVHHFDVHACLQSRNDTLHTCTRIHHIHVDPRYEKYSKHVYTKKKKSWIWIRRNAGVHRIITPHFVATGKKARALQQTTPHCYTATHHIMLQHTVTHCAPYRQRALGRYGTESESSAIDYTVLQHTATHCNTLQHTQHTATHHNTLQHTAHRISNTHLGTTWKRARDLALVLLEATTYQNICVLQCAL